MLTPCFADVSAQLSCSVCNVVGAMDSLQGISVPDTAAGDLLASFRASEPVSSDNRDSSVQRAQVALSSTDNSNDKSSDGGIDGFPGGEYPKFSMAAGDFVEVRNSCIVEYIVWGKMYR